MARLALVAAALVQLAPALAQSTWCGKNYEHGSPIVPPGGTFVQPSTSKASLLAFRCAPGVIPYLASDAHASNTLLVDTIVTHSEIAGAVTLHGSASGSVQVTAHVDGRVVASGVVPFNQSKASIPLSLTGLAPRSAPYALECTATTGGQTFAASGNLTYLPNPKHGSATKRDLKSGALLAKKADGTGVYEPVFPVGWYTNFGGYLADNLTILDDIAAQGFNVIHPIPTYDNLTALALVIERMTQLGLYLMYDMRWSYTNLTAVAEEVARTKNATNLLLWYTADEPDGWGDARNATQHAYDTIYAGDGGYHPVSLVLNCENYYYADYASGADILLQDTYMIGNNVTWSSQWNTTCTPDYGDCGCDNCKGNFTDISTRMDEFAQRDTVLGWDLTKSSWTVPQGFGQDTYWPRYPTGQEWLVQAAIAINHGAKGVVSWNAPSTDDMTAAASSLAKAAPSLAKYIFSHTVTFNHVFTAGADVGVWADGKAGTMVLITNTAYTATRVSLATLGVRGTPSTVFANGASIQGSAIVLNGVGTGAFVFR